MSEIVLSRRVTDDDDDGYRIRAWVSKASEGIDADIFAFQQLPDVPSQTWSDDCFVYVCSYTDMIELYPEEPQAGITPFFRKRYFDLTYICFQDLIYVWIRILRHIQQLLDDISRINGLPPTTIVTYDL